MKYFAIVIIMFFFMGYAAAQRAEFNQTKMRYGEDVSFVSATELGLGGSGIAAGDVYSAPSLNPALLTKSIGVLNFSSGLALDKLVEDRSFPYYDSFVGFNDYGSYAFNDHWYQSFNAVLSYRALKNVFLALAYQPFKDMRYDYQEEVRDPVDAGDKLLGYNSVQQTGLLSQASFTAAYQFFDSWSLGAQVGFLSGEIDSVMNVDPVPASIQQIQVHHHRQRSLDGVRVLASLGANYNYNKRLVLGLILRSPYTIKFKQTLTVSSDSLTHRSKQSLTYPLRLGAGLQYKFENILAAKLSFDFVYDFWSNFKDNQNPTDFHDTYTFRTGIEHMFFNQVPLRVGFLFGSLRESKDFSRTVLTLGTGFDFQKVRVNLAGGISAQEYYQDDFFADSIYGLGDRSDGDRVKNTQYFVRVDFNYSWGIAK